MRSAPETFHDHPAGSNIMGTVLMGMFPGAAVDRSAIPAEIENLKKGLPFSPHKTFHTNKARMHALNRNDHLFS